MSEKVPNISGIPVARTVGEMRAAGQNGLPSALLLFLLLLPPLHFTCVNSVWGQFHISDDSFPPPLPPPPPPLDALLGI